MKIVKKRMISAVVAVMMMTCVSASVVEASAAPLYGKFTTTNEVVYSTTITKASNKNFDTYITKKGNHKIPGQPATINVKGSLNNVSVTLVKTDKKRKMEFNTAISRYDKKTRKTTRLASSSVTTYDAGCGNGYARNAANKNYKYILEGTAGYPGKDVEPFTARIFRAEVQQW